VFPFSAALRAAESIGKIPESLILVPKVGLEPTQSIISTGSSSSLRSSPIFASEN